MKHKLNRTILPWIGKTAKELGLYIADKMQNQGFDVTKEQWVLLKILHDEDGQPQHNLAHLTDRNKASLTRLIHNLEKKNLIARIPSKEDKRVNLIFLTKKGRSFFAETIPMMEEIVDELQSGLTAQEIQSAILTLEKVQENIRKLKK